MTRNIFLLLGILVVTSGSARAVPMQPAPVEESSPALQLARRVAAMENSQDLPSRAVWLGRKAALSTRLAYRTTKSPRKSKKKIVSVPN